MKFSDIKKFTGIGNYHIDVSWKHLYETLDHYKEQGLDMCPDFQRGHVWDEKQQVSYVEYGIRGGWSGMDIFFNCAGWMNSWRGPFVLVDGLQRLTAVSLFFENKIFVFGGNLFKDFEDKMFSWEPRFHFHVNDLESKEEDGSRIHSSCCDETEEFTCSFLCFM